MQTDRIRVDVRPRSGYEAADLGFRMARTWWRAIWLPWLIVLAVVTFFVHFLLWQYVVFAGLVLWWLKPAFDRVILFVLSEALFGDAPTLRATLGSWRRFGGGLGLALTLHRFSPVRSFSLPVYQLEGLRGRRRTERVRLLVGRQLGTGVAVISACIQFEWIIWFGVMALAYWFIPEDSGIGFWELLDGDNFGDVQTVVINLVYVTAVAVVEPFYVAAGFAMYINRRVYLEGWDIDLVFRKLDRRIAEARRSRKPLVAMALCLALCGLAAPSEAAECEIGLPGEARACVEQILEHPDFGQTREVTFPTWKDGFDWEPSSGEPPEWLALGQFAAALLEALVWVGLAVVLLLVVWVLFRLRGEDTPGAPPADFHPVLFGLDVRPESLPDDLIVEARRLFANAAPVAALSLLYRGALVHLIHARALELPRGATEGECTRAVVRSQPADLAADFRMLAEAWLLCAYGETAPERGRFDSICAAWAPRLRAETAA